MNWPSKESMFYVVDVSIALRHPYQCSYRKVSYSFFVSWDRSWPLKSGIVRSTPSALRSLSTMKPRSDITEAPHVRASTSLLEFIVIVLSLAQSPHHAFETKLTVKFGASPTMNFIVSRCLWLENRCFWALKSLDFCVCRSVQSSTTFNLRPYLENTPATPSSFCRAGIKEKFKFNMHKVNNCCK